MPIISRSLENKANDNELSALFVKVANPEGGGMASVEIKDSVTVLGQKLGVIKQAGIMV